MTVYIDKLQRHPAIGRHSMWCHMIADSLNELHQMAAALGMKREWFQDKSHHPHYDLIPRRRKRALTLGAVEVPRKQFALLVRALRLARNECCCTNKDTCNVYQCGHCHRLQPWCCGAHDDIEEKHGPTCNDCFLLISAGVAPDTIRPGIGALPPGTHPYEQP